MSTTHVQITPSASMRLMYGYIVNWLAAETVHRSTLAEPLKYSMGNGLVKLMWSAKNQMDDSQKAELERLLAVAQDTPWTRIHQYDIGSNSDWWNGGYCLQIFKDGYWLLEPLMHGSIMDVLGAKAKIDGVIQSLQGIITSLSHRVAEQSELLSRKAEKEKT